MGTTKQFDQLKLFIGILFNEKVDLAELEKRLIAKFGTIDYKSEIMPFAHSDYYYQEMGQPLFKYFISFTDLVKVEDLASIKLATNDLETEFAASSPLISHPRLLMSSPQRRGSRLDSRLCGNDNGKAGMTVFEQGNDNERQMGTLGSSRQVNLDPGVMSLHNLMLLTTKNFAHRVPLKDGIYIEVTLLWQKSEFQDLPWTYPDFKSAEYKTILKKIRTMYNRKGTFPKN